MVSVNLTLVVELALFLTFYGVTRRFIFLPLYRLMQERQERLHREEHQAAADEAEVQHIRQHQAERLAGAHQFAEQRLRDARYKEYQATRQTADELRRKAEREVNAFREGVQKQLEAERERYKDVLPQLVEAMDRQINVEGSLF